jgi:hypothetical protein
MRRLGLAIVALGILHATGDSSDHAKAKVEAIRAKTATTLAAVADLETELESLASSPPDHPRAALVSSTASASSGPSAEFLRAEYGAFPARYGHHRAVLC